MNLKRMIFVAAFLIGTAALMSLPGCYDSGDQSQIDDLEGPSMATKLKTVNPGEDGTDGGYHYRLWVAKGASGVSMTVDGAKGYTANCNNTTGGFVGGKGWANGSPTRVVSINGSFQSSYGGAFGVYGWTKGPLVEYYVCEKTGNNQGPHNSDERKNGNGQFKQNGTVWSDGGYYDIYSHFRDGFESIEGDNKQFWQYLSVRREQRTIGTINIKTHSDEWKKYYKNPNDTSKGKMELGSMSGSLCYQIMFTEMWSKQTVNGVAISGYSVNGTSGAVITDYPERKTSFNSFYNQMYMRLQSDNSVKADGSSDTATDSIWYMCDLGNNKVAFRSPVNGKYLTVDSSGNVKATGTTVSTAETFTREDFYGYNYFKSSKNSKYLNNDGKATTDGRTTASSWLINWNMDQQN
jgi:endo-1,4-beta-xylanase